MKNGLGERIENEFEMERKEMNESYLLDKIAFLAPVI